MLHLKQQFVFCVFATMSVGQVFLSQNCNALPPLQAQQNSVEKKRVVPNALTNRVGSAVNWQPDVESALRQSKETGKPVFWYVHTLENTFMDRQAEVDRYMMAGPFSWPQATKTINEHYIAVKAAPTKQQQQRYDLMPFKFVEPGFLVLDPLGEVKTKIDRITTMHPAWFDRLLAINVKNPIAIIEKSPILARGWELFRSRDYLATTEHLTKSQAEIQQLAAAEQCESGLLMGMATFRLGLHEQAKQIWQRNSQAFPDQPLAWKSAAESQGLGPFMRGFEIHIDLPNKAMNAGVESAGSAAPASTYREPQIWQNSVQFMLAMQNQNGSFTDSDYDFGGTDSLPNVHVAVTSLAGMAMLKASSRKEIAAPVRAKLDDAVRRAVGYVIDGNNINRIDRDEILWAHAYRLRLLSRYLIAKRPQLNANQQRDLLKFISQAVTDLESVQSRTGSWYHEYANPFVTATALVAIQEAQQAGASVNQTIINKGVAALSADRFVNGAYPYGHQQQRDELVKQGTPRDLAASAGRMPLCELGLWCWGKSSDENLISAVERSLDQHKHLDAARKYDDHTSRLAYGGFFFWYDMRSRSEAISRIQNAQIKKKFADQQRAIILGLPELDGCFVDSHELGRVYGTAMALLSLSNCQ